MCDPRRQKSFGTGSRAAMFLVAATLGAPAGAASLTWNSVTADWTIGTNWTPGGPPGVGDVAIVNAGNAQLNSDTTILGLTHAGGTISGTGYAHNYRAVDLDTRHSQRDRDHPVQLAPLA